MPVFHLSDIHLITVDLVASFSRTLCIVTIIFVNGRPATGWCINVHISMVVPLLPYMQTYVTHEHPYINVCKQNIGNLIDAIPKSPNVQVYLFIYRCLYLCGSFLFIPFGNKLSLPRFQNLHIKSTYRHRISISG